MYQLIKLQFHVGILQSSSDCCKHPVASRPWERGKFWAVLCENEVSVFGLLFIHKE